jgi:SnoaL-like domain
MPGHDLRGNRPSAPFASTIGGMTNIEKLVEDYLETWNLTSDRRAAIARLWAPDGRYVDPLADVRGHDQLDAVIAAAQSQFAGLTFALHGTIDAHHDVARFQWGLGPAGEEPVAIGFDVLTATSDGQIESVVGFLDKVPAS